MLKLDMAMLKSIESTRDKNDMRFYVHRLVLGESYCIWSNALTLMKVKDIAINPRTNVDLDKLFTSDEYIVTKATKKEWVEIAREKVAASDSYPPWECAMPVESKDFMVLDVGVLEKLLKMIKAFNGGGNKKCEVKLVTDGDKYSRPLKLSILGKDAEFLIVPVRY